ncbi:MAG: gliding motility lipoprotein GldD [Flavobacteriaceae bacterium]|nr:gliding motility lipoprotein GldD [Flavobacteriaceae bacterium]
MRNVLMLLSILLLINCTDDVLPKPKGYLSLKYPKKVYQKLPVKRPFTFDVLKTTNIINEPNNWLKIKYPNLNASIDITYRNVDKNMKELITEAEKLVFKHAVKAEQIMPKDFVNPNKRVFGSLYEITGNAASQLQFHVTDSTTHFLKGALYFYAKPNYDSVLPAVAYIKKDVLRLIESLEWKSNN